MDQRANFLALILLDALEDENKSDVYTILNRNDVDAGYVPLERGIAPLHYSCGMENEQLGIEITRHFLDSGTDPNVLTFEEKMTPLHVAAINGRDEIVKMLLAHGAKQDMYDVNNKMPVHYAIEGCHFEMLQLMRDHIFVDKYDRRQQQQEQAAHAQQQQSTLSQTKFENSVHQRASKRQTSTPHNGDDEPVPRYQIPPVNKNLQVVNDETAAKYTPNRVHYNYDVTSPYYINITHRRHKPQPLYPATNNNIGTKAVESDPTAESNNCNNTYTMLDSSHENGDTRPVNIFALTRQNLEELSHSSSPSKQRTRASMIQEWREKAQRSHQRQSMRQVFDDIGQMIDHVVASDDLNFTNTALKPSQKAHEMDGGAPSLLEETEYVAIKTPSPKNNKAFGQLIQRLTQLHTVTAEFGTATKAKTVKEPPVISARGKEQRPQQFLQVPAAHNGGRDDANASNENFIRSPSNAEYFMQMTEAYVHTDDENGLVFYETKLLSNPCNKAAQRRQQTPARGEAQLETTATSQSTNVTLPADYETDALRTELTTFGEPPGPITQSTKRLYIKRLVKYKRKTQQELAALLESKKSDNNADNSTTKFSVELHRTLRSLQAFQLIPAYAQYEKLSAQYFANHDRKRPLREGHLKQSFIYMLIDPRVSCNLPGESAFLEKFDVWKRFLQSIFYVGKGKSGRPYSHLYEAMKTHSRLHQARTKQNANNANAKQISIRKQQLNVDLFKSPPEHLSHNKKLDRILDIWSNSVGVVCLHVFHQLLPAEAYTREAAIIDALSLQHLTNVKRGDYYGLACSWTMREKKQLGIALLYKAMQIYLAEGESQLSPSDLL